MNHGTTPSALARYIGIDYSGAQTPTVSLKGLHVYRAEDDGATGEVPPPHPRANTGRGAVSPNGTAGRGCAHTGRHRPRPQGQGDPARDPRRRGEVIFLPPSSLDLNPIEQVLAKLKHFPRKAAARTAPATGRRIGTLLDAFSPAECANYFVSSGYASV